ncbi:udp-glucose 4-epimerase [Anaeramoeba flamelloides]|uniref:Udp-glucose 4-epimerase n=1 Tax=Anaeramoeba flamelloides TaxID=1746091 RepID=A0ABQ8X1C7_9EUKA|nr:udp-glucose 4-epimerase [Anaeramoeba flamelloides]
MFRSFFIQKPVFNQIIPSNWSEVACRAVHAAKCMGIKTVIVYYNKDGALLHLKNTYASHNLASCPLGELYLQIYKFIKIALNKECETFSSGYGLLSEGEDFLKEIAAKDLVCVGPSMSCTNNLDRGIVCPFMIKSTKKTQTQVTNNKEEATKAFRVIKDEMDLTSMGKGISAEKMIGQAKIIGIQVLADKYGNCVYLPEKGYLLWDHKQNLNEECTDESLDHKMRRKMGKQVRSLIGYSILESKYANEEIIVLKENENKNELKKKYQKKNPQIKTQNKNRNNNNNEKENTTTKRVKGRNGLIFKNGKNDFRKNDSHLNNKKPIDIIPLQLGSKVFTYNIVSSTQITDTIKSTKGKLDNNPISLIHAKSSSGVALPENGDLIGTLIIKVGENQKLQVKGGFTTKSKERRQIPLTINQNNDRRLPQDVRKQGSKLTKIDQIEIDISDWKEGKYIFDYNKGISVERDGKIFKMPSFELSYFFKRKLAQSTGIYIGHYTNFDLEDTRLLMLSDEQFKRELIKIKVLNKEGTELQLLTEEDIYYLDGLIIKKDGSVVTIDQSNKSDYSNLQNFLDHSVPPEIETNVHKGKTVLITGGSGYIATVVIRDLLRHGSKVIIIDRVIREMEEISKLQDVTIIEGNIEDNQLLKKTFQKYPIDSIVNLAADIEAGFSMREPAKFIYNNVIVNALNLYDHTPTKAGHTVFASSAGVYDGKDGGKLKEDHGVNPQNPYGETKLLMEKVMANYSSRKGIKFAALRFFNVAGATKWLGCVHGEKHIGRESHIIPILLENILGRKELNGESVRKFSIFGNDYATRDGTNIRSYIHIQDLSNGIIKALARTYAHGENIIANLGSERAMSNLEVYKTAQKVTGINKKPIFSDRRPGDPDSLDADWSKAKRQLGWKPLFSDIQRIILDALQYAEKVKSTRIPRATKSNPEKTEPLYLRKILIAVESNTVISKELKYEILFRTFIDSLYNPSIKDHNKQPQLYQAGKALRAIQQEIILSVYQNKQFFHQLKSYSLPKTERGDSLLKIKNYLIIEIKIFK